MSIKLIEAVQSAREQLGLDEQESGLTTLALYLDALTRENAALRERLNLLLPERDEGPVAA